jgi:uncharacterized protein YecE (DUF72 family)
VSRSADRLAYYASAFSFVEVDATYYALLPADTARGWLRATPSDFLFHVKAHPILTGHPIDVQRLPDDLKRVVEQAGLGRRVYPDKLPVEVAVEMERRFFDLVEPLRQAERLGAVLAQFPPWFTATRGNARRIEALVERHPDARFSVEFRHESWLREERRERVLSMLRALGVSYVCVDEPRGESFGMPPVAAVTNPELAVVRFHGRNVSGWGTRGASVHQRFNYLYSVAELRDFLPSVQRLSNEAASVHVVFNNCVRDYAVLNAKGLAVLMGAEASVAR